MTHEQRAEALRLANSIGTGYPSYEELADASDMLRVLVGQLLAQATEALPPLPPLPEPDLIVFDAALQSTVEGLTLSAVRAYVERTAAAALDEIERLRAALQTISKTATTGAEARGMAFAALQPIPVMLPPRCMIERP